MLRFLQTPGPIKKIILGAILVVVCVMMVITLVPGGIFTNYLGLTQEGVLAQVGDQQVSVQEVSQQARLIGKQQFKNNVPSQLMPYLMQRAAEGLITQAALVHEADKHGPGGKRPGGPRLSPPGQFGEVLFPNGNFIGQQAYEHLVQSQFNMGVTQFETEVKAERAQTKLLATVTAAVTVSDKDILDELKQQDTKVKFDYAVHLAGRRQEADQADRG